MKEKEAEKLGYTHRGIMYGFIPVFVSQLIDGAHVAGVNKLWDMMLDIALFIDRIIGYSGDDFFIVIKDKL
ncbi:hypothetical protein [Proteiniphilum sp. UBA5463]|jgi:hypothetical protein|uniref:hypothetical protein n=1 Tax=Proteiniphilum sp. UBA5463 TaxID=1947281 RepID=UPI00257983F6|nr:hypothetical protein [Proteiniphilum sp. UBA5463]